MAAESKPSSLSEVWYQFRRKGSAQKRHHSFQRPENGNQRHRSSHAVTTILCKQFQALIRRTWLFWQQEAQGLVAQHSCIVQPLLLSDHHH